MSKFRNALLLCASVLVAGTACAENKSLGLGRPALPEEIKAWDTAVRPDGKNLPIGKGTVKQGDDIFQANCAVCHGEFGQGVGRWPELAGGQGSLTSDRPLKTIGSYWPHVSTVFDYINRAMPFGNNHTLTTDQVYAVTAYILSLNDVIKDDNFELNEKNLATIKLPNEGGFREDDRETAEKHFWGSEPCMKDCKTDVKITSRAAVLDVTPENKNGPKVE